MYASFFWQHRAKREKEQAALRSRYTKAAAAIYDELFPEQQAVIDDPFRKKSVLCPRRAGKTHTGIAYALHTCLLNPGANVVIVTLTLKSAKKLYWKPVLELSDRYGLNFRRKGGIHNTHGIIRLENGSELTLVGADSYAEIEKLRGPAYDLVIVDECKSFGAELFRELVEEVIIPACSDRNGSLLLIGTPGAILSGPFFEATYPEYLDPEHGEPITRLYSNPDVYWNNLARNPKWSRHTWSSEHNIFKPDVWKNALQEKIDSRWADDNPIWLREYLGLWVPLGDAMVYAFASILTADRNEELPRCIYRFGKGDGYNKWGLDSRHDWRFVMGLDIGFEDDTAISVGAYSPTKGEMYIVYEWKQPKLVISQIASQIKLVSELFNGQIEAMVADTGSGGKTTVESLNRMYGTFLVPAQKTAKNEFVQLFNSDLYDGKIKVLADSELAYEWRNLQWYLRDKTKKELSRSGQLRENPKCPNHLSDATLYLWRYCYHHFSRDIEERPMRGSEAWEQEQEARDIEEMNQRRRQAKEDEDFGWDSTDEDDDGWNDFNLKIFVKRWRYAVSLAWTRFLGVRPAKSTSPFVIPCQRQMIAA